VEVEVGEEGERGGSAASASAFAARASAAAAAAAAASPPLLLLPFPIPAPSRSSLIPLLADSSAVGSTRRLPRIAASSTASGE